MIQFPETAHPVRPQPADARLAEWLSLIEMAAAPRQPGLNVRLDSWAVRAPAGRFVVAEEWRN